MFRGVLLGRCEFQLNPLDPVATALRQGDSIIFFPEGTRGPGRNLQPLKPGIFCLARRFPAVDICPVWIDNSYRVLPKGFVVPVPARCSVTFGSPLRWKPGQQQEEFLTGIRSALEAFAARLAMRNGSQEIYWIIGSLFAAVSLATCIGYVLRQRNPATPIRRANLNKSRIRSWWVIILVGAIALLAGRSALLLLFAVSCQ